MLRSLFIIGAALAAAPLAAQTTTQCSTSVGITTCNTTGQSNNGVNWGAADPNAFQRGYDQSKRNVDSITESYRQAERERAQRQLDMAMIRQTQQAQAQNEQAAAQHSEAKTRGIRAGQLVAAGDCAGAQKLALDDGDFELANAVKDYCAK